MKMIIVFLMLLTAALTVHADYSIDWCTIDSGGGASSGGPYQLTGTIGQQDAGYHDGGQYELLGGFWVGGPRCIVNLEQFATLASYWLEGTCSEGNGYCGGADLDGENGVNIDDLKLLADEWLNICPANWPLH